MCQVQCIGVLTLMDSCFLLQGKQDGRLLAVWLSESLPVRVFLFFNQLNFYEMKKRFLIPMLAILACVVVAFGASAFKSHHHEAKLAVKYFKFIGSSSSDYYNPAMWQASDSPYGDCGGSVNTCTVSSTSQTNTTQLTNFLNNSGSPRDPNNNYGTDYLVESQRDAF